MGLSGDIYSAMHILLPQTEHIFRNLIDMCGDTMTNLKKDREQSSSSLVMEEYKTLSKIFDSALLRECYDEKIICTFRWLMDHHAGPNLRNNIAHGLLSEENGNSGASLYFLCMLIKWLSLYVKL